MLGFLGPTDRSAATARFDACRTLRDMLCRNRRTSAASLSRVKGSMITITIGTTTNTDGTNAAIATITAADVACV